MSAEDMDIALVKMRGRKLLDEFDIEPLSLSYRERFNLEKEIKEKIRLFQKKGDKAWRQYMDEHEDADPDDVRENIFGEIIGIYEQLRDRKEDIHSSLFHVEDVEFEPSDSIWSVVQTSSTSEYRSQPASEKYAKGALLPEQTKLEEMGFETHIQPRVVAKGKRAFDGSHYKVVSYRLWANGPEWMVKAACNTITISYAAKLLAKNAIHPEVVMPMAFNHPDVKNPKW